MTTPHLARALWTLFEPIHALTYFSPQSRQAFAEVGLTRYWDGYFAGRAAPLGQVHGAPVVAMFGGFSPTLVDRALPAVWQVASPARVLEARARGAETTLRSALAVAAVDETIIERAATALEPIAAAVDTIGRPLAAANRALPIDPDPYRSLWQSAATLREHRGDGHVIAQVVEGIAGLSSVVLRSSLDLVAVAVQRARGWSDDEWMHERSALTNRGLIDRASGRTTAEGAATLARVEEQTNHLALTPWADLSGADVRAVAEALHPVAAACLPLYPFPNPIGVPVPWNPFDDPEALLVAVAPRE